MHLDRVLGFTGLTGDDFLIMVLNIVNGKYSIFGDQISWVPVAVFVPVYVNYGLFLFPGDFC